MQMLLPLPRGVFGRRLQRESEGNFDAFAQVGGNVEVLAVEEIAVRFLEVSSAFNFTEAKFVLIELGGGRTGFGLSGGDG